MSKKLVVVATQESPKEIFPYKQHIEWRPLFGIWCVLAHWMLVLNPNLLLILIYVRSLLVIGFLHNKALVIVASIHPYTLVDPKIMVVVKTHEWICNIY